MATQMKLSGSFTLPGSSMTVSRMGYGAMQLAGPQVWGPRVMLMVRSQYCERRSRQA